jgi:hypothetical protein
LQPALSEFHDFSDLPVAYTNAPALRAQTSPSAFAMKAVLLFHQHTKTCIFEGTQEIWQLQMKKVPETNPAVRPLFNSTISSVDGNSKKSLNLTLIRLLLGQSKQ